MMENVNKKKRSKHLWLVALAAVIVLLIVFGLMPKAIPVSTESVTTAAMQVLIEEEGHTRVIDRFVVASPISGYARRIEYEVGDAAKNGESILVIESMPADALNPQRRAEAQARVAAAEATLRSAEESARAAKSDAALATSEVNRVRGLLEADAATMRDVEIAEAQQSRAAAQNVSATFAIDVAKHNLEAAGTALQFAGTSTGGQRVTVTSPIDGIVLAIHHKSGGVVGAGTPMLEVGDPTRLEVAIDVLSQDATRIEPGMKVHFERWGGSGELEGVVRTVEPVGFTKMSALGVEEQRVWVIVDFSSPRAIWRKLGSGYRVIAQFVVWDEDDVKQIPSSAAFRSGGDWRVFQVVDGVAVATEITIGQRSGLRLQVLDGLADGDIVVVHPPSDLTDGLKVKLR